MSYDLGDTQNEKGWVDGKSLLQYPHSLEEKTDKYRMYEYLYFKSTMLHLSISWSDLYVTR